MQYESTQQNLVRLSKSTEEIDELTQNIIDKEIEYIIDLKSLHLAIRSHLSNYQILTSQQCEYIGSEIQIIAKFHQDFLFQLKEQFEKENTIKGVPHALVNFIQYLQTYNDYISRIPKIVQKFEQLSHQYSEWYDLKFQISEYFTLPFQQILSYKTIIDRYLELLTTSQQRQKCQQVKQMYFVMLQKIRKFIPELFIAQQRSSKQLIYERIQKNFSQILSDSPFQIAGQFQGGILKHRDCKIFVVNQIKQIQSSKFEALYILVMKKRKEIINYQEVDYVELGENSFIQSRPNGFYFKNKILICGKNKSLTFFFNSKNQSKTILSLLHVPIIISRFQSNELFSPPYEAKITNFSVLFTTIGLINQSFDPTERCYAIKFDLLALYRYSQTIFLKENFFREILDYMKQLYEIQFPEYQSTGIFGRKKTKQYIEEVRCIYIEQVLNTLIRKQEIRKRPQFLFKKINLSESMWCLATASSFQRSKYKKESLSNLNIQQLHGIVNEYSNLPQQCLSKEKEKQKFSYTTVNPFIWIMASESLYQLLYKQEKLHYRSSKFRKTSVWNEQNLPDKLLSVLSILKQINERMNPKIRLIDSPIPIQVTIYNCQFNDPTKKIVHCSSKEDTVQTILKQLGWAISLDNLTEFGLMVSKKGHKYYLDKAQRMPQILVQNFDKFYLKKLIKLPVNLEEQMLLRLNDKKQRNKVNLIMGEIVDMVKKQKIILNKQQIISYITTILSLSSYPLSQNSFQECVKRYLPLKFSILGILTFQSILESVKNISKQTIAKKYSAFLQIFVDKQSWSTSHFTCKISSENKRASRAFFSCQSIVIEYEVGINYKQLIFKKKGNTTTTDNLIPERLSHNSYILQCSGEVLCLKIKQGLATNKQIFLFSSNSLYLWRLATIYKGMLEFI